MTAHRFPELRLKLPALAAITLLACTSCFMMPLSAQPSSRKVSPSQERQPKAPPSRAPRQIARYPDPRYRPPVNFAELQAVAGKVARATGRKINWRLKLGANPGPLALVRGGLDDCTIFLHPVGSRKLPPNTWAFIIGHEFAHRVENLGDHARSSPAIELKADIAGARYAMAAGYRVEAFLGWVLTEPDNKSATHGSLHQRVYATAAHFGIPKRVIQAEARRYSKSRASR